MSGRRRRFVLVDFLLRMQNCVVPKPERNKKIRALYVEN